MDSLKMDNMTENATGLDVNGTKPLTMRSLQQTTPTIATILLSFKSILVAAILIGNILVLAVYARFSKIRAQPFNVFIVALAITDFGTGLFTVPMDIYRNVLPSLFDPEEPVPWFFNSKKICLFALFVSIQPQIWSATSVVLISLDRLIATFFPLYYYNIVSRTKAVCCIIIAWFIASTPLYAAISLADLQTHDPTTRCTTGRQFLPKLERAIFYVWSAMPVMLCIIIYFAIILRFCINKSTIKSQKRFTITMAVTIGVFIICMFPLFVLSHRPETLSRAQWLDGINVALYLVHANSFMNVIIYNITNKTFRHCFLKLLGRKKEKNGRCKNPSHTNPEVKETSRF